MTLRKLVAVDLDGTFWRDDQTFHHAKFTELLAQLDLQGGHFAVATGNDRATVDRFMAPFVGRFDYVTQNGAQVVTKTNQTLALHTLDVNQLQTIHEAVGNSSVPRGHGNVFASETNGYMLAKDRGFGVEAQRMVREFPNLIYVASISDIPEPILKVIVKFPEAHAEQFIPALRAKLNGQAHVTTSGFGAIDVIPAGINKAVGLQTLAAHYGLEMTDITAFGDGFNDLEMLRAVGQPFAMPNGHADLFAEFPAAAATNNDDGVLATLLD